MSRELIREAFAAAVATVFQGKVYTTRMNDNRDDQEYVSIYIEDGDVKRNSSGKEFDSNIVVRYCKQRATDEQLDLVADQIVSAVESSPDVRQLVRLPLHTDFSYEPDSVHNGLNNTFRIIY